ncbi:MAG: DUF1080 domain-containing protein [Armatimonadetes bacterium]|nr:DUF1080 domain-containing protein [Akkermansiaceae bacterium]
MIARSRPTAPLLFAFALLPVSISIAVEPSIPAIREGWKVELIAQTPEIKHPSVVCTAPDGRVFVAEDPMDIREDTPADSKNGRIICLHPGGKRTVFASGLHAVFGMQYLEGKLYVLHNPSLTVFRDENGTGRDALDILTHTLPEPWAREWNDHIPANFKLGMDGWFYLSVGDKGLYGCTGSDGRVLNLKGGGIARFRPDGSELEIFSTGVRNILDLAITAEDELFSYDNTDEHQWMGRLTHMVEGGEYGYPYDFIPRRPYTLWMMHDFGAGAACGTLCNTDDALPPEMNGNLLLADFGKRQVTMVNIEREGASWRMARAVELFPNPPDDFRPVGLGWAPDGKSFYICDWQFRDQKTNQDLGRLWKVTWTGDSSATARPEWWIDLASGNKQAVPLAQLAEALAHPARSVRLTAQRALAANVCEVEKTVLIAALTEVLVSPYRPPLARMHALWTLDALDQGVSARDRILELAGGTDHALAAQSLRQLSQRRVAEAVAVSEKQLSHTSAIVRFQATTLLGRVGNDSSARKLIARLGPESDPFVLFAISNSLKLLGKKDAKVLVLLVAGIASTTEQESAGCRFALRDVWAEPLVPLLLQSALKNPAAAELLRAMVFQPAPWRGEWSAYHPAKSPPPPRATRWPGTDAALRALSVVLATSSDPACRLQAAEALAADPAAAAALRLVLENDPATAVRAAALSSLAALKDAGTPAILAKLLLDPTLDESLRLAAVVNASAFADPPIDALTALLEADAPLPLRLAAIETLGQLKASEEPLLQLLKQGTPAEKLAVVKALGRFANSGLTPRLLEVLEEKALHDAALLALTSAPDVRAVAAYLDGLGQSDPVLSQASRQALVRLGREALPAIDAVADTLPPAVRGSLKEMFKDDAEALKHPLFSRLKTTAPAAYETHATTHDGDPFRGQAIFHGSAGTACIACHQVAGHGNAIGPDLTLAGKQFSRAEIIESILHPNKVVRDGYQLTTVKTADGRELNGFIRGNDAVGIRLVDLVGQSTPITRVQIVDPGKAALSIMPEGLHAALTPAQFTDLVAYLASRISDPRTEPAPPLPDGFQPLFNGTDLAGWRMTDINRLHWSVKDGRIIHDGVDGHLWSEQQFGDFTLHLEWRWPDPPTLTNFPLIDAAGRERKETERVLDAGDSGVYLRGLKKAQANLFCYPVGSGEFWEYREDRGQPPEFARTVTPKQRADAPIGDWNAMRIEAHGDRVTILLNGQEVISDAALPGLPARGPIGFQHEHGRIEIRAVGIKVK